MHYLQAPKVAIYTAIFGGRDKLKNPLYEVKGADLICFTDDPTNVNKYFNTIIRKPSHDDPVRSARKYKILGDPILEKYDYTIWVDGNMLIKFYKVDDLIGLLDEDYHLAMFKHSKLNCIYDEYNTLMNENENNKFDIPSVMQNQIQTYKDQNFPAGLGLVESGVIVRKNHSERVKIIMKNWWNEVSKHSRRDQLSFNYVIWKLNERYNTIPGTVWDNEFVSVLEHLK